MSKAPQSLTGLQQKYVRTYHKRNIETGTKQLWFTVGQVPCRASVSLSTVTYAIVWYGFENTLERQ